MEKKSFLDMTAPSGYVAGIGRGASGFSTRSDIGSLGSALPNFNQNFEKFDTNTNNDNDNDDNNDDENYQDADEEGLLSTNLLDKDDREADEIYEKIEQRLQNRKIIPPNSNSTKSKKRKRSPSNSNEIIINNPQSINDINSQFQDLKRELATITDDQWLNLPEPGDLTKRNKRERDLLQSQQRSYAIPDSLITGLKNQNATDYMINPNENDQNQNQNQDQDQNVEFIKNQLDERTDFSLLSSSRIKILGAKLDNLDKNNTNKISLSSHDYLSNLDSNINKSILFDDQAIRDINKSRLIFKSLRKRDPYNVSNWISSAKIEIQSKNFKTAKKLLNQGCNLCKKDENIWLENINLNLNDLVLCKKMITEALSYNPKSEILWLKAYNLENELFDKRRIIRKALQQLKYNVNLWKISIDLESDDPEKEKLLSTALFLIPKSVDLWLQLFEIQKNIKSKRKILSDAFKSVPSSHKILIEICKLEESVLFENKNNTSKEDVFEIIQEKFNIGFSRLKNHKNSISRKDWLRNAMECENSNFILTCQVIINKTITLNIDQEVTKVITERKSKEINNGNVKNDNNNKNNDEIIALLKDDFDFALASSNFETSRSILLYIVHLYPTEVSIWKELMILEKNHSFNSDIYKTYQDSIKYNPEVSEFWLRYAKEKWINNEIEKSREILENAIIKLPQNEEIWLAAIKLESSNKYYDKALDLLSKARKGLTNNSQIWCKSIILERQLGNSDKALDLIEEGVKLLPKHDEFYIQKGKIFEEKQEFFKSKEAYKQGIENCPNSPLIWILYSKVIEKADKNIIRSRSMLDRGLIENKDNEDIWCEKIKLEIRNNIKDRSNIDSLISKALQVLPNSAKIWSLKIKFIKKKSQRKNIILKAMKETKNDPIILLSIGEYMLMDGKLDKAKSWFLKAINEDRSIGDCWVWLYLLLKEHGTKEEIEKFFQDFRKHENDISRGEHWVEAREKIQNFEKSNVELLEIVSKNLLSS
ncbi:U4/U6-U5 snRNP complex subunit PRP6 [Ascoidea rubescens DSM 1968]|uniref:Protein prenylyltransferase n=1 Tax=Ascoidea rubescens DSM 1968 TaxID=1344418 RepID=A0A1D2VRM5_9ASCO|nr:protein prenylyltransferase [Ascoidea rubescens DSM 1968]ODV64261.1 protein prenylyltransferase [Ascoidea rubescens DSM 1968]